MAGVGSVKVELCPWILAQFREETMVRLHDRR